MSDKHSATSEQQHVVRDDTRTRLRRPWALSAALIVVITAVYVAAVLAPKSTLGNVRPSPVFRYLALRPDAVVEGAVFRLFTANLLHPSLLSLLASVLTLLVVGSEVEERWGARRYVASVLIVSLGATVPVLLFAPEVSRWASGNGAMLGLVGAALVIARRAGFRVWAIVVVGALNVAAALWGAREVSLYSLIGGLLTGALIAVLLIAAPSDHRRNRVQALLLGALFGVLVLGVVVAVLMRGA